MTNYKALCAELLAAADEYAGMNPYMRLDNAMKAARAALAKPELPADGEVAELVNHLLKVAAEDESDGCTYDSAFTRRAADLLERLAPQPVPKGPSDAELIQLAFREKLGRLDSNGNIITRYYYPMDIGENVIDFARAVLDRWGQP
jgi:hypothetical protein